MPDKWKSKNMEPELEHIYNNILIGQEKEISLNINKALASGLSAKTILDKAMIPAMSEIGHQFEIGECFIPEMLIAARAMQSGLNILEPNLETSDANTIGKIAIGTVKGDLHDIGKNLVVIMMKGAGFEVLDLGSDVTPEEFVVAARTVNIIALSAMLTTTMVNMKITIDALTFAGVRNKVKVIVGGAPLTVDYAKQVGADGYAPDASRAVSLIKTLLLAQ